MLSDLDRAVLEFEGSWWRHTGPKDRTVREVLGMSATRYYQILRRLVEDPAALEADPLTVRRLRRVRDEAKRRSLARRLGDGTPTGG